MTIKTQAYLRGYLHEKTAAEMSDEDFMKLHGGKGGGPLPVEKPRWKVTSIVAAPGIPQTAPDPGVKPLFPDGKAKFKATQVVMPKTTLDAQGRESLTPASVNDQLLRNVPGGAAAFVAKQRKKFEEDSALNLKAGPRSDLISFDKRNQPVSLDAYDPDVLQATDIDERRIVGVDPEKLRENPKDGYLQAEPLHKTYHFMNDTEDPDELAWREYVLKSLKKTQDYSGLNRTLNRDGVETLGHELNHNYLGGDDDEGPLGPSYITDVGAEYTQGVTSGLNAMRDVTGEYLNDPQQVHQLFDEIIAKPSILDSITPESARVFRTYLTLRKTNPELAEQLRESMARDSQYLVKNEPAGGPMVKIPRSWV